ncbi:hypothetical protein SAMN02910276_00373 [Butyrivibrio sp. Su6]|nr:hypothetical protein SAMN02910276_00373 [Butyrivibrio sp. Su6]
MKFKWAYRPISRLGPPVKKVAVADNYRICPIACDKKHGEGWLQAWNQAMSPKKILLRVANLVKTSYMPKVIQFRNRRCEISTVPIILTVGRAGRAFSSGSVNGGVPSQYISFTYKNRQDRQANTPVYFDGYPSLIIIVFYCISLTYLFFSDFNAHPSKNA